MRDVKILDTTLRDGEQTAGIAFSPREKVRIARELDQAGVDIIEAGIPAMGGEELQVLARIVKMNLNAEIISWNRMKWEDVEKSLLCGLKSVHISAPVSDLHIKQKLKKDREWVLREIRKIVSLATGRGLRVSVGAEDASRAELSFVLDFYTAAAEAGAERVRFADTVGALDPFSTAEKIVYLTERITLPLDFHGHNDLGMATANALAAVRAGAGCVSCTVNGLGERAGNTALAEITAALKYLDGLEAGVEMKKLYSLSRLVARCSGRRVPEGKPLVGEGVFSHEAGIHVDGLLKDSRTYEFVTPGDFDRKREIVFGKFSGSAAMEYKERENSGVQYDC